MLGLLKNIVTYSKRFFGWVFATNKRKMTFWLIAALLGVWQVSSFLSPDWELEVETPQKSSVTESVIAAGEVSAEKFAELTFLATENISEIFVEDGAQVKKGELIARLDTTSLYQSYLSAEAELKDKQATLDRVYDDLKGKETSESFTEKETRVSAETSKDKAYRAFVIAQKNLANASLNAPFDGIVNYNLGTSLGELSLTTKPTFTIVDPTTIYFEAEVGELEVSKIRPGTKVEITLDAFSDRTFEEEVLSVGFVSVTTSTGGTAYRVKTGLEKDGEVLRPGMNGDAEFVLSEKEDVLLVPLTAIVEEEDETYLWVIRNGLAKKVQVETGISSINEIEIVSGLEGAEKVIIRPPQDIAENDRVKVI